MKIKFNKKLIENLARRFLDGDPEKREPNPFREWVLMLSLFFLVFVFLFISHFFWARSWLNKELNTVVYNSSSTSTGSVEISLVKELSDEIKKREGRLPVSQESTTTSSTSIDRAL